MNKIKEIRKRAGITQKEAAQILGVALRTLQDWEGGKRTPHNLAEVESKLDAVTALTREGINSLLQDPDNIEWVLAAKKEKDAKAASKWGSNGLTFQANWERIPQEIKESLTGAQLGVLVDIIKAAYDDGIQKGRKA